MPTSLDELDRDTLLSIATAQHYAIVQVTKLLETLATGSAELRTAILDDMLKKHEARRARDTDAAQPD